MGECCGRRANGFRDVKVKVEEICKRYARRYEWAEGCSFRVKCEESLTRKG